MKINKKTLDLIEQILIRLQEVQSHIAAHDGERTF